MAIYHLSAQVIGRAAGRSATAAAAYRLGTVIDDERTGQRFDYSRKRGVDGWRIIGPTHMPARFSDPAQLWNAVEAAEKRQDAQLCREINVALPCELTPSQNTALVADWCQCFADAGMVACVALHHLDSNNPHAHAMLTMREVKPEGFGPKVRAWNDRALLDQWRDTWAQLVNRHLAIHGVKARVDHRSLDAQGVERTPTQHQGPIAHAMDQRGAMPDRLRVVVPTPAAMDHAQAVKDRARERSPVPPGFLPDHVRQAAAAVVKARETLQAAEAEETRRRQAEQHADRARSEKRQVADADRKAALAARQRAEMLGQELQTRKEAIERWKRNHRWRVWWWRHGVHGAIPRAIRDADVIRTQVKQRAAQAARDHQNMAGLAGASRQALTQADNAHQHSQRMLLEAQRRVEEATEQARQANTHWVDIMAPDYEQRQAERRRIAARTTGAPTPTRRRLRSPR